MDPESKLKHRKEALMIFDIVHKPKGSFVSSEPASPTTS